jgi:OOP family OmpA-OmpF porin
MCRPLYWLWGLIPLALVALLALYFRPPPIQQDLTARANAALSEAGEGWASVTLDGRDLRLSGIAPSEGAQTQAEEIALSTWGVRVVDDVTELLALADPFLWKAEKAGSDLTITGNIPAAETRGVLADAAGGLFDGVSVNVEELVASRGVPELSQWNAGTAFALEQLSKLTDGSVSLENLDLSISGVAPSSEAYEDVVGALGNLPAGLRLAENAIEIPAVSPHRFGVERDENSLVLNGFAPSFEVRTIAAETAQRLFPEAEIDNQMRIASGPVTPGVWATGADYVLEQLARLKSGSGAIVDDVISVSGEAASISSYEEARAALGAVPTGFSLGDNDIAPAPADSFTWTAGIDDDAVTIGGFAPSEDVIARISDAAETALPNRQIETTTQVAAGPVDAITWGDRAGFSLGLLKGLEEGRVLLTPSGLSIDGRAASVVDYEAIQDALSALPEGLELVRDGVLPAQVSPFTWSAVVDGASIQTSGFAPSGALRNGLVGRLADSKPGSEVESTVRVASGDVTNEGFDSAVDFATEMLGYLSEGTVSLSDNALSVDGTAATVESFDTANALAARIPAGLVAGTMEIRPAAVGVLTWSATRDGRRVELDGFVPSEAIRSDIVDAANEAVSGANVVDNMEIANGGAEAAVWGNAASFGLRQLGRLSRGTVELNGTDFSIEGVAPDFDSYNAVLGDVPGALPGGLRLSSQNVLPPSISPYVWGARKDDGRVTLTGHVPNTATRDEVVSFAQRRFGSLPVSNAMTLASGAPSDLIDGVGVGLSALQSLNAGSVALLNRKMTVTGVAPSEAVRDRVINLVTGGLPDGFEAVAQVTVVETAPQPVVAESCQDLLNNILAGNIIRFEVSSAQIRPESIVVLDQLLEAARRCPDARIEVAGHTDSDGSDELNLQLSQARADSVRGYLVDRGIPGSRLIARGYGESSPIASNDTDAGKARNRRIEFNIQQ